ncbi:MAG: peptidoglycan DD-metalloendopeptidase family protein [Eubacterium sp.]|nr:peptidoglycan DD-metalloendopeptidase family protein [Eubacterium sp.]
MTKKRIIKAAMTCMLAATFVFPVGINNINSLSIVKADDLDDAKKEKEEAEAKKKEAEDKLATLNQEAADTNAAIEQLDVEIGEYNAKIAELKEQRNKLQAQLTITEMKLQNAHIMEKNQYASMKKRMQYAYENGDIDYISALISIEDFDSILNQSEYVEQVSTFDQEQLNKLIAIKKDIADGEEKMKQKLKEINDVKAENEAQQGALQVFQDEKKEKLGEYNLQISETNSLITELDEDIETKASEIAALEAEVEKKRQEAAAAAAASSSSDDGDTYVPVISGDGTICCWPCPSSYYISSPYGPRDTGISGASTWHRGIDIGADYGVSIVAAGDGYVASTGYSYIRGNYIIISHGNGLCTLYQHMSGFAASTGDNVSAGQTIGYVGETGVASGAHLHFEVWVNEEPVNPRNYI